MTEYAMSIKDGNGLVFRTKARSLIEAKEYFRQLKQIDEKSFNKLYIVTEIKDNERKN